MTVAAKRKKLHDLITTADDKYIDTIFSFVEENLNRKPGRTDSLVKIEKITLMQQASADPLFLADVKEIGEDFDAIDK